MARHVPTPFRGNGFGQSCDPGLCCRVVDLAHGSMQTRGRRDIDDGLGHLLVLGVHPVRRQCADHAKWSVVVHFHDDVEFFIRHFVNSAVMAET